METFPTNNSENINQNEAHSEDSPMSFSEHMASREAESLQDAVSGLNDQDRDLVLSIAGLDSDRLLNYVKQCKKEGSISRTELAESVNAYYKWMMLGNDMQTDIDNGKQELVLNLGESRYVFAPIPEDCGAGVRENMAATRANAQDLARLFVNRSDSEYLKQQAADAIAVLQKVNNNYNGNAEEYVWDLIRDAQENEENQDPDATLSSIKIGANIKTGNDQIKELRKLYLEKLEEGRQKI